MTGAAFEAERLQHHPEWSNVYNRVTVDLVTHDAQGITALDFDLARRMQQLASAA
jgi:4a-hydroxytetrahydrobiopterin dehydratase